MALRDFIPRHTRGYLWISFLVAIFLFMALSENGIFTDNILPSPVSIPKAQNGLYGNGKMAGIGKGKGQEVLRDERFELPDNGLFESVPGKEGEGKGEGEGSTRTKVWDAVGTQVSKARVEEVQEVVGGKGKMGGKGIGREDEEGMLFNGLSPKDVVVLVKTGATSLWRRMPGHMSTTLSSPLLTPNILIYSDTPDSINNHPIIDSLANISTTLKSTPDFDLYTKASAINAQNLYLESGSMEGDAYLPGGWRLDKYKFVPMFAHAERQTRGHGIKWYIYMEDDNYFFWENLYSWLGSLDHTKPLLIGSPAFRLGEDFAHGGSGFAVSGAAMESSFGAEEGLAARFEEYARTQCCGDQVLSHVFKEKGVKRYKDLDGGGWAGLQSLPVWRIGFGTWNWCSPIMNVHKVHQADISRLFEFETSFKRVHKGGKGIRYRDLFAGLAKGNLNADEKIEWDNYASAKNFASSSDEDVTSGKEVSQKVLESKPWFSKEACRNACVEWEQCLSWKYADDNCGLDHTAAMGQKIDAGIRMESGWMLERIKKLEKTSCEALTF